MNDVVSVRRIIVKDIVDDFFDGQVLSEFVGEITINKLISTNLIEL